MKQSNMWEEFCRIVLSDPTLHGKAKVTAVAPTIEKQPECDGVPGIYPERGTYVHTEYHNVTTDTYYYLCGVGSEMVGLVWHPTVHEKLTRHSLEGTVGAYHEQILPVLKLLVGDNPSSDQWEVNMFSYDPTPTRSITNNNQVVVRGRWRVAEPLFIDGVKQPLKLISKY